ncbi:MAG TPA: UDP-glucose/GDP-mannose dehydrogenase family protein [Chthonomonadales bacterium]|nr:UDP-glucose/GDP-mannose dehydrogenase family protein [Chthonomonadales bacterium]
MRRQLFWRAVLPASGERTVDICVIGTGYVGLVTGSVFADLGNEVICADKDAAKIEMLGRGVMPIYEPGLEEVVARNVEDRRLSFTTDVVEAVSRSEVVFICVGTPTGADGQPDTTQVEQAAQTIARALNRYKVVVNKSTVPVGTGDRVREIIETNRRRNVDFDVVSNPEFLREGSAIHDTLHPDRIVIGAPSKPVAMVILELYAPLERPMLITDVASAEIIKYASNAFLATKISFINAIANICEEAGADVVQVVKGMGYDQRIGSAFLQAGLGYGGSCFPKDTNALIHTSDRLGYSFDLLKAVTEINRSQTQRFMDRLERALGGFEGRTVALLGLTFKPNTDDLRDAKSLEIIERLLAGKAEVCAYDPIAMDKARAVAPSVRYCESAYEAASGADAMVLVTEWNEFKFLNLARVLSAMRGKLLFDGRNLYDPVRMQRLGFDYHGIGRSWAALNGK